MKAQRVGVVLTLSICLLQCSLSVSALASSLYNCTLIVNGSIPSALKDCRCHSEGATVVCANLHSALQAVGNLTQVIIQEPQNHTLSPLPMFRWLHDVSLQGTGGSVRVTCEQNAGLSFVHSQRISVEGLEFHGCGTLHNSTSRDYNVTDPSVVRSLEFKASLYFELCENVSFSSVTVADSNSIGLVLYSSVGNNTFENCTFANNSVQSEADGIGGGGVYVEFPYCLPDKLHDCHNEPPDVYYSSDAHYHFLHCYFEDNYANSSHPVEYLVDYPPAKNHQSLGRGGGLCVYLCIAARVTIEVEGCNFSRNRAVLGGGLLVEFLTEAKYSIFKMVSTVVQNNNATFYKNFSTVSDTGGGGMMAGFAVLQANDSSDNTMEFNNCTFQGNRAYWGGGLVLIAAREPGRSKPTNTLKFCNCMWKDNMAQTGSAVDLSVYYLVSPGAIIEASFTDCRFVGNNDHLESPLGILIGEGAMYTEAVPVTFKGSVLFESNKCSALVAVNSAIDFVSNCSATFRSNSGRDGGAVLLVGSSFIRVGYYTKMYFINNIASRYSGAIYAHQIGDYRLFSQGNCFIQYTDFGQPPQKWTGTFYFENNTARYNQAGLEKNDSIGAISLHPCVWVHTNASYYHLESRHSPLSDVFCWSDNWNYSDQDCNVTTTSPAVYNQPNYTIDTVPGRETDMHITMFDDRRNDVTSAMVLTAWTEQKDAKVSNRYIAGDRITIYGGEHTNVTVYLSTIEPRRVTTKLTVMLTECPLGFYHNNTAGKCVCEGTFRGLVRCHEPSFSSLVQRGYWIGRYNNQSVIGLTPYMGDLNKPWIHLKGNDTEVDQLICGPESRTNRLCGNCIEGYGVSPMSVTWVPFRCHKCTKTTGKWAFVLSQYVSVTVFLVLLWALSFLDVGATKGPTNAYIFFAQVIITTFDITGDGTIRFEEVTNSSVPLQTFTFIYEIWNLNFFRAVLPDWCISEQFDAYDIFLLHYTIAVCPIIFLIIFYVVGKCIYSWYRGRKIRSWLRKSLVDVLATFIVLSYSKFALVSAYILTRSGLYSHDGKILMFVMYYRGTIEYLSHEHLPFFVLALFVTVFFVILPPLALLVYPSVISKRSSQIRCKYFPFMFSNVKHIVIPKSDQHCTELMDQSQSSRGRNALGASHDDDKGFFELLLQSFQKCYKDGSRPGWRDCRYFAGIYFLFRSFLFLTFSFSGDWLIQYCIQQAVCMLGILFFTVIRPYQESFYNNLDATMFGILAVINVISIYNAYQTTLDIPLTLTPYIIQVSLIFVPFLYVLCYVAYALWKKKGSRRVIRLLGRKFVRVFCIPCLNYYEKHHRYPRLEEENSQQSSGYAKTATSLGDESFSEFMSATEPRHREQRRRRTVAFVPAVNSGEVERESSSPRVTPLSNPSSENTLLRDSSPFRSRSSGYGTTFTEVSINQDPDEESRDVREGLQTGQTSNVQ